MTDLHDLAKEAIGKAGPDASDEVVAQLMMDRINSDSALAPELEEYMVYQGCLEAVFECIREDAFKSEDSKDIRMPPVTPMPPQEEPTP